MAQSEETTRMDKATFLATLQRERAAWDALLAEVSELGKARMTQPGVNGEWSVKDIIAHVTWYEREMVGLLRAHTLDGSPLWELPNDQRNAALFEELHGQPFAGVQSDAHQTFADLVALVEGLAEEDLHDASRYRNMPPTGYPGKCWRAIPTPTIQITLPRSAPGWTANSRHCSCVHILSYVPAVPRR